MKQMALDIGLAPAPTLAAFVPGRNLDALQHVRLWAEARTRSPVPVYLWGDAGAGKTHLLRAARQAVEDAGGAVGWLDPGVPARTPFREDWEAVLMDDVQDFGVELQHTAFAWFVQAVAPTDGRARAVLAAGRLPPADLALREDLRTRLGWGHVFQLHPLSEDEVRAALRQAAQARGLALPDDVLDYVLVRRARDLSSLMGLLERLDRYALQRQRAITIPLLRTMLEDETRPAPH